MLYNIKKMQYTINSAPSHRVRTRRNRWAFAVIGLFLLILGVYLSILLITPKIQKKSPQQIQKSASELPVYDKNTIFIPSVGVQSEIGQGGPAVLDKGLAWNRLPEQGNPVKGGNMVITGHSFVWGYDPSQVTKRSIFYDLKNAKVGGDVLINWYGKQYKYTITKVKTVKPSSVEIENQSSEPMLTIYTCTLGGSADGRVVVIAKPS
jgi:sortase A